ncbi:hypothetical protein CR152_02940 [Massilia violaceinigra]|uniref:Sel1 repeat family protein n=1 Tax=Massilia violaceinigra TaxID=2045208 RepID=A0A2D2DF20_9BURK|nr:tetratricopeptide repeat protein [Massilia violaceinigra]ATQ73576.1 hypothetical protein CR152_02940 [Massilia violaceinigra]
MPNNEETEQQYVSDDLQLAGRDAALEPLRLAAESGDAEAQVEYARTLHQSFDDPDAAFPWMERAAEQQNPDGLYGLALYYNKGWGCVANPELSFTTMRTAAEAGNAWAQFDLGLYYMKGYGCQADMAKAVEWISKAAEAGLAQAQYEMGVLYLNGEGMPQNLGESLAWFMKAGEQNHPDAVFYIGAAFYDGLGVEKDPVKGMEIMRDAVQMGSYIGQQYIHKFEERSSAPS